MTNNLNPSHYAEGFSNGAELIDITENLNFNRGNAVKYLSRAGKKNKETEIEDLRKAEWYITREIERVASNTRVPGSTAIDINWALNYQAYDEAYENLDREDWELSLAEGRTQYYDEQPRVVPRLLDKYRDSWWQDVLGDTWRWYGYEDGNWQYFDGEMWCDIQPGIPPSTLYAPFTEVPAE